MFFTIPCLISYYGMSLSALRSLNIIMPIWFTGELRWAVPAAISTPPWMPPFFSDTSSHSGASLAYECNWVTVHRWSFAAWSPSTIFSWRLTFAIGVCSAFLSIQQLGTSCALSPTTVGAREHSTPCKPFVSRSGANVLQFSVVNEFRDMAERGPHTRGHVNREQRCTPGLAELPWTGRPTGSGKSRILLTLCGVHHKKSVQMTGVPSQSVWQRPRLPLFTPNVEKERECRELASAPLLAAASWGSQMDLITVSQKGNILELDRGQWWRGLESPRLWGREDNVCNISLGCKDPSYCCFIGWG